jgi:octanoyl-[GcvH]:protein N-octanoyltransferase
VGTAQRVVRDAWLFSALVVVADEQVLRPVLAGIYACLGQPLEVASVGSVSNEVPGLDVDAVEDAVLRAYAAVEPLPCGELDSTTLELAREMATDHRA